jgi:NAD+ synthase (glutamine-hydrolysing)
LSGDWKLRLGVLQLNFTVGDLSGNARRVAQGVRQVQNLGGDLAITSELALLGYPPRDLLLNEEFVRRSWEVLADLARELSDAPPLLIGLAEANRGRVGRPIYNAAALLRKGTVQACFRKALLPTYDVFDEDRYFEPARGPQVLALDERVLGVSICEDVWNDRDYWARRRYHMDPVEELAKVGARTVVNLSASPFTVGKQALRQDMLSSMARRHGMWVLYVNQVGGNDDLVFDGCSCAFDPSGRLVARGASFAEDVLMVDFEAGTGVVQSHDFTPQAEMWNALVLGTRDYARKCGFQQVLLGLSGGIDSSVVAAVAAEAVGSEKVLGVLMPSPYSSMGSLEDSERVAKSLGIQTIVIPIQGIMKEYDAALEEAFIGHQPDLTEENIQSRIRGNLLMALSNKYGALLLTTGNKSELAVGYCTIYGDMSGGLAVIADLPKGMVYHLARWLNRDGEVIPEAILTKPPSAELRPNQTDQDSLPPYDVLDAILELHIDRHLSAREIVAQGFDPAIVGHVLRLVRLAEFKRRQAAPGLKVTDRAFGTGWRMPIARRDWEVAPEQPVSEGEAISHPVRLMGNRC